MPFFRSPKFDLVVVAVHYREPGRIDWVRAFERRGATWSDRRMIRRADLIELIRAGKKVVTGNRVEFVASTFETHEGVRVEERGGEPFVVAGASNGKGDALLNVPLL